VVVIEGAAGMGKSRLLDEARAEASERGFRILNARATELEQGFPYGIMRQLLERLLVEADSGERERWLAGAAALAAEVLTGAPAPPAARSPSPSVSALISARLFEEPDEPFVLACLEVTGGNPFLVGELLSEVAARGLERAGAASADLDAMVPRGVANSVLLRLARLAPGATTVARALSVLGGYREGPRRACDRVGSPA
jgi:predicted ATPase